MYAYPRRYIIYSSENNFFFGLYTYFFYKIMNTTTKPNKTKFKNK